ncbi:MAG: phosphatase PAP2 family protein [Candidatus Baltobacteraceae bacterium]
MNPDPGWLLTREASWVNHSTLVAWWFTFLGYAYALGPMCVVLLVLAWRFPQWRWRILFSVVMLVASWQSADFFQHFFARPRRLDWVVRHETAYGFPSSHAAIATGFYLLWSVFLWRSALRGRAGWAVLVSALAVGIMWSRLALGAHYLTDVLAGAILAAAIVALGAALVPINVFARTAGRP